MNTTYKVGALSKALNSASNKNKKVKSKETAAEGQAEQVDRAALNSLFSVPKKRPGPLYVPYIRPTQSEESRKRKRIDGVESEDDDNDNVEKLSATQSQKRKKRWPGKLKMEEMAKNKVEEDKRTVFVGNLSNEMSRKAIAKIFKVYGEIDTIRIRSAALADPMIPRRVGTITRDFHPKRNNLNAYVKFRTVEEAEAALKLNGTLINKFHIRVDMAEKKAQNHNKRSVFLGNLPFDVEEETVFSHFEDCGDIEGVRLIRDPKTGIGKGFGYVIFKTTEPVELALRLEGSDLDGRELRVSRAVQNPSRNFISFAKNK